MIRSYVLHAARKLDVLQAFIEAYPELALDTVRDTFNARVKPFMLDELHYTPGESRHPWGFATPKSRRYYFYAVRSGLIPTDGERYLRSGETVAAWQADVIIGDNAVVMSVKNPKKHIKWLTGKRQVPGHAATGWPLHDATLDFWAAATREETGKALRSLIGSD